MNTQVESLHFNADPSLQDFVVRKVSGLEKIFDRIESCKVLLKFDKSDKKMNKVAEISLVVPQSELFASDQADTFELAADLAVSRLKKQLKKYKERKRGF